MQDWRASADDKETKVNLVQEKAEKDVTKWSNDNSYDAEGQMKKLSCEISRVKFVK